MEIQELADIETGRNYALCKASFLVLAVYLVVILAFAAAVCVKVLGSECQHLISVGRYWGVVLSSIPFSLVGSGSHYLRKLYLLAFHPLDEKAESSEHEFTGDGLRWCHRATILYFLTRPVLVSISTAVLLMALLTGMVSIVFEAPRITESGFDIAMVVAFLSGVSGGKILDFILGFGLAMIEGFSCGGKKGKRG